MSVGRLVSLGPQGLRSLWRICWGEVRSWGQFGRLGLVLGSGRAGREAGRLERCLDARTVRESGPGSIILAMNSQTSKRRLLLVAARRTDHDGANGVPLRRFSLARVNQIPPAGASAVSAAEPKNA
jgi:hypothetical protein